MVTQSDKFTWGVNPHRSYREHTSGYYVGPLPLECTDFRGQLHFNESKYGHEFLLNKHLSLLQPNLSG